MVMKHSKIKQSKINAYFIAYKADEGILHLVGHPVQRSFQYPGHISIEGLSFEVNADYRMPYYPQLKLKGIAKKDYGRIDNFNYIKTEHGLELLLGIHEGIYDDKLSPLIDVLEGKEDNILLAHPPYSSELNAGTIILRSDNPKDMDNFNSLKDYLRMSKRVYPEKMKAFEKYVFK
jgi:hypothetical protein